MSQYFGFYSVVNKENIKGSKVCSLHDESVFI